MGRQRRPAGSLDGDGAAGDVRRMPWLAMAALVAMLLATALVLRAWAGRAANQSARRVLLRFRARVDRFKLTRRAAVRLELLADPRIAEAVRAHAAEHSVAEDLAWERVERYIDEMVPFFSVLAYYRFGYVASRRLLRLFYKVSVERASGGGTSEDADHRVHRGAAYRIGVRRPSRDAVIIYLMNHRSNADYVLVGYALSGQVAISYAVGEWARAFPLEHLFKAFGAYFIRRRFREPLYHAVLERYVQLITRHGVTQGIFPEGGLTRDGLLRPAKIGLLDYIVGAARDPALGERLHLVPVAINYDRVLEDRSLLRELTIRDGAGRPSKLSQLGEVLRYLGWNAGRLATHRWKRYGRAAVTIGDPIPVAPWLAAQRAMGADLFELQRPERLARVQALADAVMREIGSLIPVTPVPLACAAIQSLESDFIARSRLLARMMEMRDVLVELNGRVIRAEGDMSRTLDLALRLLTMRHVLEPEGEGFVVLPRNRGLISYYANSIAHLLGPFEAGVRTRDTLPAMAVTGEHAVLLS